MAVFVKYLGMIGSALIACLRLLNMKDREPRSLRFWLPLFTLCMSGVMVLMRDSYAFLRFPVMFVVTALLVLLTFHTGPRLTLTVVILGYAVGHLASAVGYCVIMIMRTLLWFLFRFEIPPIVYSAFIACGELAFTAILFRFRVWNNGGQFLQRAGGNNLGVVASLGALGLVSYLGAKGWLEWDFFGMLLISIAEFCLCLWYWFGEKFFAEHFRTSVKRYYKQMDEELEQRDRQEADLRQKEMHQGDILHDYKRVMRAMEEYSEEFLIHEDLPDSLKAMGQEHTETLRKAAGELGIKLSDYEFRGRQPTATHIHSVDMMMHSMQSRAAEEGVDFQLWVDVDDAQALCKDIRDEDIRTLLTDLVENALNAVKDTDNKHVYVEIHAGVEPYQINVFDSGTPISSEVLGKLGERGMTSHPTTGGSGIGMMTILQLCRGYKISFEHVPLPENGRYTKRISLCFDGQGRVELGNDAAQNAGEEEQEPIRV